MSALYLLRATHKSLPHRAKHTSLTKAKYMYLIKGQVRSQSGSQLRHTVLFPPLIADPSHAGIPMDPDFGEGSAGRPGWHRDSPGQRTCLVSIPRVC